MKAYLKNEFLFLFVSLTLMLMPLNQSAQDNSHLISTTAFDSIIDAGISIKKSAIIRDTILCLKIVRAYNTILWDELSDKKYGIFCKKFEKKLYYEAKKTLKMIRSKGGSSYSQVYNIYLGGAPHNNSRYFLVKE